MTRLLAQRWWLPAALLLAYAITRLVALGALPMVSDEGTYITWGVRALHATAFEDWLASLEDGKQPLLAWLMPPFLSFFPDRLIAGRLVSVLTGLANLVLITLAGRRLFGPTAGWVSGGLYVIAPIALVHDRMALYDSLVTTTSLLVLLAALSWPERPTWMRTVALGGAMGLALLTKLSALFFIVLVPPVALLWSPAAARRWWRLAQAYFLAAAVYSILYLSPIVENIQEGNFQRYSLTAGEILQLPLSVWLSNATFVALTAVTYLGWPLALAAAAGLAVAPIVGGRSGRVLALWTAIPLLAFILTAKIIYSRYVVFCFVAALPAAAYCLVLGARWLRGRLPDPSRPLIPAAIGLATAALIAFPAVGFGAALLSDPARAPWFDDRRWITDRFQYVESNYAGYGLSDLVAYLKGRAALKPIVVVTRDATGMPRDGVTAYLAEVPNVHITLVPDRVPVRRHLEEHPTHALQLANAGSEVFYVLTDAPGGEQERRFRELNPEMSLVQEIAKPGNHSRFQLYRTQSTTSSDDVWLEPSPRFRDPSGVELLLRGYNLSSRATHPNGTVRLILYWEVTGRPPRDLNVFNHVLDAAGTIRGQKDGPAGGQVPTSRWRPRQLYVDVHQVQVKEDAPPEEYDLVSGLYDLRTLQRLPVHVPGKGDSDRVALTRIRVTPALQAG